MSEPEKDKLDRSRKIQKILEDPMLSPRERILEMRRYLEGGAVAVEEDAPPRPGSLLDRLNRRLDKSGK